MKGTPEEEISKGSVSKYDVLRAIHQRLKPNLYLEIGVQKGKSLALCTCECVGVDPEPKMKLTKNGFKSHCNIYAMKSDEFFDEYADDVFSIKKPDLVFIDGMHLIEFVLRDFINVEKYSKPSTVIVLDDIFPAHPAQAERERRTRKWTGDVWKIIEVLHDNRPELNLSYLDVAPTGMLLVTGLDSQNTVLTDRYQELMLELPLDATLPPDVLDRIWAIHEPFEAVKWALQQGV